MTAPEPQKVAVITGASQGIGAGLADGFRRSGYGWWAQPARSTSRTTPATSRWRGTSPKRRRPITW